MPCAGWCCDVCCAVLRALQCTGAVDKFLPVVFANLDVILNDKKLCKEASLCLGQKLQSGVASA